MPLSQVSSTNCIWTTPSTCIKFIAVLYLPVFTFNSARDLANVFFISFLCHLSHIPEVYKIETGNSELFDEFGSQEQHSFVLGISPSNGSETATDLIQKLYLLFSTGELLVNNEKEAQSEEMPALADGKQQDKKGNLGYNRIEDPEVPLDFPWSKLSEDEQGELTGTSRNDRIEVPII